MYADGAVFHLEGEEWKEITVTSGNVGSGVEGGGGATLLHWAGLPWCKNL